MSCTPWTEVVQRSRVPVVIISHNQLSTLSALVDWLEASGHERVIIVDNASTYEPLLEYLGESGHEVLCCSRNIGHTSPWVTGLTDTFDGPFVVTDPDVLPDPACPNDATEHFQDVLLRRREFDKAGFGLVLDDIPERYPHRDAVRRWEAPFWEHELELGVFAAHIDTTFAVYRPGTAYKVTEALRTGPPYVARHVPWYRDPGAPDTEMLYFYRHRRADIGFWDRSELPDRARRRPEA